MKEKSYAKCTQINANISSFLFIDFRAFSSSPVLCACQFGSQLNIELERWQQQKKMLQIDFSNDKMTHFFCLEYNIGFEKKKQI